MNPGTGINERDWPHGDVLASMPNFIDVDADGDYDLLFSRDGGLFSWIENIGTASVPDYGDYALRDFTGDLLGFNFVNISFVFIISYIKC